MAIFECTENVNNETSYALCGLLEYFTASYQQLRTNISMNEFEKKKILIHTRDVLYLFITSYYICICIICFAYEK